MRTCLWKVAVGMALFGFVATLEVSAAVAKEPTAITDQTKSFEGVDRDAAHEAAMKWIDDLNQHGPLRIKRIVVVERGRKWIATITYTEGEYISQARAIRSLGIYRDDAEKAIVHRRLDAVVQARRAYREATRSVA